MTLPSSWKKSSWSTNSTNCVEVVNTLDAVRDSKNAAVVLPVSRQALAALVRSLR